MEVSGGLSVNFQIKSTDDLRRITEFCQQFEAKPVITSKANSRLPRKSMSKEETKNRIIDLLKATFPRDGFIMRDAIAIVLEKLDRRSHTVQQTIQWATDKGTLMRKGRVYIFTEFIQGRIAAKLKNLDAGNQSEPKNNILPLIPAGEVS